jgi:hypothetical protein
MGERQSSELERRRAARGRNDLASQSVLGTGTDVLRVACECGRVDCRAELTLSPSAYRNIRRHQGWFLLLDGHEEPDDDRIVYNQGTFAIVDIA